jgi:hypothetical protein
LNELCGRDADLEIVFLKDDASKQMFTFGEIFRPVSPIAPSPSFTGLVDVALGEFDCIFAQRNGNYPTDQAALVQPVLSSNADKESQSYIAPGAGYAINIYFLATQMYDQVQAFVKNNVF